MEADLTTTIIRRESAETMRRNLNIEEVPRSEDGPCSEGVIREEEEEEPTCVFAERFY